MFKRFIRYYKNHLGLFILDMICATLVAAIDLVFPLVTSLMTKNYIPNKMIDINTPNIGDTSLTSDNNGKS